MILDLPAPRPAPGRILLRPIGRVAGAGLAVLLATAAPLAAQLPTGPSMPYGSPVGSGAGGGQSSPSSAPIPPSNTNSAPTPSTIYQPIAPTGSVEGSVEAEIDKNGQIFLPQVVFFNLGLGVAAVGALD